MEAALALLGIAQDGGVPHAGCSCARCMAAHIEPSLRRHPVACGVRGSDGSLHLIEASRSLPDQMRLWATTLGAEGVARPDSVSLTHVHLGHIDGLGQFGDEVMGCSGLPLFASPSVLETLAKREALGPFSATEVVPMECFGPSEGCGFEMEFVPVPHRDEHADTHAVVIRGPSRSILSSYQTTTTGLRPLAGTVRARFASGCRTSRSTSPCSMARSGTQASYPGAICPRYRTRP